MRIFESYIDFLDERIIYTSDGPFFRARKNQSGKVFKKKDLEAPPRHSCKLGRLNPAGVRYLYVSDSVETCWAEVRPWIDAKITVGKFYPKRCLLLKDLTLTEAEKTASRSSKRTIKRSFSKPVSANEGEMDYLITQCITEYIRYYAKPRCNNYAQFDGIVYNSSANTAGYNIILFNPEDMVAKKNDKLIHRAIKELNIIPKPY